MVSGDAFIVQVNELLEVVLRNGEEIFAARGSAHEQVREGVFDQNGSACFMEFLGDTAPCLCIGLFVQRYNYTCSVEDGLQSFHGACLRCRQQSRTPCSPTGAFKSTVVVIARSDASPTHVRYLRHAAEA